MFLRIKKIKEKYYAYNVQNKRVNNKIRQKVKEYLGKVLIPLQKKEINFQDFIKKDINSYIQNTAYKEIIENLVRWELKRHDLDDIQINIKRYSVEKNNSRIVIKLNEGYLYSKTLSDLLKFQAVGDDDYFIGKEFAELFVKAGINIPKDLFIKLFEKITNK